MELLEFKRYMVSCLKIGSPALASMVKAVTKSPFATGSTGAKLPNRDLRPTFISLSFIGFFRS